jgi:hypothetical protein
MSNWLQIPGGQVINADNMKSLAVEGSALILEMVSRQRVVTNYSSPADAYAAKASIESAVLNPTTSPTPVISSISPNAIVGADGADLVIVGVDFRSTASLQFVANPAGPPDSAVLAGVFVSTNTLAVRLAAGTLTAGTFDVVYTDSAGSADTLATGLTVT